MRDTTNANYNNTINTINFLINQNARRNLNIIQKAWVLSCRNCGTLAKLFHQTTYILERLGKLSENFYGVVLYIK
jgi:hypothetical protein